jgi:coronin-1B/1C/6
MQSMIIAGKGDGNIRYYEYESNNIYMLDEHKSSNPQHGVCFVPRRTVNTLQPIEPIASIVPRKVSQVPPSPPINPHHMRTDAHASPRTQSDLFQSDMFPPRPPSPQASSSRENLSPLNMSRWKQAQYLPPPPHPPCADAHTLCDGTCAPARTGAVALAHRGPTTPQSRERAPAATRL